MDKKQLRAQIRAVSNNLTEAYRIASSEAIARQMLSSPLYRDCTVLFTYVSMPGEPDTTALLRQAFKDGKHVLVPKCLPDRRMAAVEITSFQELEPGAMGIPEPVSAENSGLEPQLVIVPCVSAWHSGARLGHGGGYYDIYLANTAAVKLCLCFDKLLSPDIPMEALDVPMDYLATEKGLAACNCEAVTD